MSAIKTQAQYDTAVAIITEADTKLKISHTLATSIWQLYCELFDKNEICGTCNAKHKRRLHAIRMAFEECIKENS